MTNHQLNVLVLCEATGTIRETFVRAGHSAVSVDVLPTTAPRGYNPMTGGVSRHIISDALAFVDSDDDLFTGWDLVIARPPCTYLTNSGVRWLFEGAKDGELTGRAVERWSHLLDAIRFFNAMKDAETGFLAIENPIPHRYARLGIKAGLDELAAEKPELAALVRRSIPVGVAESVAAIGAPTQVVQPYHFGHTESKGTGWWLKGLPPLTKTDDVKVATMALPAAERNKVHYASPGADRWAKRSALVQGMADAIVDQWGGHAVANIDWVSSASSQGFVETGRRNTLAETEAFRVGVR